MNKKGAGDRPTRTDSEAIRRSRKRLKRSWKKELKRYYGKLDPRKQDPADA